MSGPVENTDREIWRGPPDENGDTFYSPSIHVTERGDIGINVGGKVIVMPVYNWHYLADPPSTDEEQRTNDLEGMVSQLLERVEKLEHRLDVKSAADLYKTDDWHTPNTDPYGNKIEFKPASEDGHHIARALEKMK